MSQQYQLSEPLLYRNDMNDHLNDDLITYDEEEEDPTDWDKLCCCNPFLYLVAQFLGFLCLGTREYLVENHEAYLQLGQEICTAEIDEKDLSQEPKTVEIAQTNDDSPTEKGMTQFFTGLSMSTTVTLGWSECVIMSILIMLNLHIVSRNLIALAYQRDRRIGSNFYKHLSCCVTILVVLAGFIFTFLTFCNGARLFMS